MICDGGSEFEGGRRLRRHELLEGVRQGFADAIPVGEPNTAREHLLYEYSPRIVTVRVQYSVTPCLPGPLVVEVGEMEREPQSEPVSAFHIDRSQALKEQIDALTEDGGNQFWLRFEEFNDDVGEINGGDERGRQLQQVSEERLDEEVSIIGERKRSELFGALFGILYKEAQQSGENVGQHEMVERRGEEMRIEGRRREDGEQRRQHESQAGMLYGHEREGRRRGRMSRCGGLRRESTVEQR